MAGSTRILGNALMLEIGATDYKCDVTAIVLDNEEMEDATLTFCDAGDATVRQYFFEMTGIQSTDTASLWQYIWTNTGDDVAFTYAPHGNATPTVAQPHFTGTVTIGPRPSIGGEASRSKTEAFTFETRWDIVGTPVQVTT